MSSGADQGLNSIFPILSAVQPAESSVNCTAFRSAEVQRVFQYTNSNYFIKK